MRAHLVQLDIAWEDRKANHGRVAELVKTLAVAPGDLILLPEMFDTGFSLNIETTADRHGDTSAFLSGLARRAQAFVQGGTTVIGPDGRGRNRMLVLDPRGSEIARYDKIHPFSFGREQERFAAGDRVVTYRWGDLTVCPVICYDLRFPELFRGGLALGAQIFTVGANWPSPRLHHWRTLLQARAIENQAYVLGANRCGADPYLEYPGASMAISPRGETLSDAGPGECVVSADVDGELQREWRDQFPAWRDGKAGLLPRIGVDGAFAL